MRNIKPSLRVAAANEWADYARICGRFGHTPTEEEKREILKFIVLMTSSGSATLCESDVTESVDLLMEGHGHDHEDFKFFDEDGHGGHGGHAGHADGIEIGKYVAYIFKRPRIMGLFSEEMRDEFSKIQSWSILLEKKKKLAELRGDTFSAGDYPKMYSGRGGDSMNISYKPKPHGH
jgi:hypothetical protein